MMPDYGTIQLLYRDMLREAARKRRPLVLTFDSEEEPAPQGGNRLLTVIKGWLGIRQQRRKAFASH